MHLCRQNPNWKCKSKLKEKRKEAQRGPTFEAQGGLEIHNFTFTNSELLFLLSFPGPTKAQQIRLTHHSPSTKEKKEGCVIKKRLLTE